MKTLLFNLSVITLLFATACGGGSSQKTDGSVKFKQVEKDAIAVLSDEGETNFKVELRTDEKTKKGTEHYKSHGAIPFETYFVRTQSNWKYKGNTLDVYRHLEVKYYKIDGEWMLDRARVFNSWLDNVDNPIEETTMLALIKKDPWGTFGHQKAKIGSITLVTDFYNGMPGIQNGQFYPTDYSSKQVKCVYDIVFEDKERKKGRYEIKFGRGGVDQPWDRVVSYRKIKEETI
jgi:hypothetical protein